MYTFLRHNILGWNNDIQQKYYNFSPIFWCAGSCWSILSCPKGVLSIFLTSWGGSQRYEYTYSTQVYLRELQNPKESYLSFQVEYAVRHSGTRLLSRNCLKRHFSRLAVSKCCVIYHWHFCDRSQRKSVLNHKQFCD